MSIFTKQGDDLIEIKKVLMDSSVSDFMKKAVVLGFDEGDLKKGVITNIEEFKGIKSKKIIKDIKDCIISEEASLSDLEKLMIEKKVFIDIDAKKKAWDKLTSETDRALTNSGLNYFTFKEIKGSFSISHKIGYNKFHFMRYFRLTSDEFETFRNDNPEFFQKYSELRLLALFKKFKNNTKTYDSFTVGMTDYYYDDKHKTHNRDVQILLNTSVSELLTTSIKTSTIREIKLFFESLKELTDKIA